MSEAALPMLLAASAKPELELLENTLPSSLNMPPLDSDAALAAEPKSASVALGNASLALLAVLKRPLAMSVAPLAPDVFVQVIARIPAV